MGRWCGTDAALFGTCLKIKMGIQNPTNQKSPGRETLAISCVIGNFVPITRKALRGCAPRGEEFNASRELHCGGVESCRKRDLPQAENPASRILFYFIGLGCQKVYNL